MNPTMFVVVLTLAASAQAGPFYLNPSLRYTLLDPSYGGNKLGSDDSFNSGSIQHRPAKQSLGSLINYNLSPIPSTLSSYGTGDLPSPYPLYTLGIRRANPSPYPNYWPKVNLFSSNPYYNSYNPSPINDADLTSYGGGLPSFNKGFSVPDYLVLWNNDGSRGSSGIRGAQVPINFKRSPSFQSPSSVDPVGFLRIRQEEENVEKDE